MQRIRRRPGPCWRLCGRLTPSASTVTAARFMPASIPRAARLHVEVERRGRSIDEHWIRAHRIRASRQTAGPTGQYSARSVNDIMVERTAGKRRRVLVHCRAVGVVEDVCSSRRCWNWPPQNMIWPDSPFAFPNANVLVGYRPVVSPVSQLNRPASVHVIEDVVDDRRALAVGIDPVVEVQVRLTVGPADVMKCIAIKSEVVFR